MFADPGGDAVQVTGYFGLVGGSGTVSFDPSQKVVGVGSWKCDSGPDNQLAYITIAGILETNRRVSMYRRYDVVPDTPTQIIRGVDFTGADLFSIALIPSGAGAVLRFISGATTADGTSVLLPNTQYRISFAYNYVSPNLTLNVFLDAVEEISVTDIDIGLSIPVDLRVGWLELPGTNRSTWIDCAYVDVGDDLADPGIVGKVGPLATAKLPATVNADNFDTVGGTGAVNERPVDLNNYRAQLATAQVDQNYTLQSKSQGDVSLAGKLIIGSIGWVIAKKSGFSGTFGLTFNGVTSGVSLTTSPSRYQVAVTGPTYPSNAAGIGLRSPTASNDTFLYECGAVIVYFD
ncbi:MAG TPA: hypothetical protein VHO25_15835 [Polyangiaceae bacterium]|nr:hypothetical protein [Polyangiaceae bacterium]